MSSLGKRVVVNGLRYGICAAAVWWVLRSLSWEDFRTLWREASWGWLGLAVLVYAPIPALLALRLKWLLNANHVPITLGRAIGVTLAGNFASFVLPGQTGGDFFKAVYVARETERRHEAATVVFFDRLLGLMCVVILSGALLLMNWRDPAVKVWGRSIGIAFAALLVPGALYFSDGFRRLIRWERVMQQLPLREHVRRIDNAVLAYRDHRWVVVRAMLLTWGLQAVAIFSTYLAGRAIGMTGPTLGRSLVIYLIYVPLCWMAGALPISPQGLGVMEWAYTELLHRAAGFGTAEGAALLSMLARLINLAWAMPGIIFHLRFSRLRAEAAGESASAGVASASGASSTGAGE
ncbi:MAG: flippase-like domain-containing protein [Phycisphaerae bacterium]|nr:flippase-like domain-containing protein [Phycisphaerae bacterium]